MKLRNRPTLFTSGIRIKQIVLAGLVLAGFLFVPMAIPRSQAATAPINSSYFGKVAIEGYDPVAYFTQKKPVEGSKAFTFEWQGAVWRFASKSNRDAFATEPEKFAPQYGGYCAWAVSQGYTASIDPKAWKIVNGKLYLNYSMEIQEKWLAAEAESIKNADKNWPQLLKK